MNHRTWEWEPSAGQISFAQQLIPDRTIQASILLIHGFGEHTSRYDHFAEFYASHDIQVLGFDLHGHGRSGGARGHIPTSTTYFDEIDQFLINIQDQIEDKPLFIYGHSMGGMITLSYVMQRNSNFAGVITTSPLIDTAKPMDAFTKKLAKFMDKIFPKLSLDSGLDRSFLSRDKAVVDAYNADPLIFGKTSTRLGSFMIDQADYLRQNASQFPLPLLMMVGSEEKIVNKSEIDQFMTKVPSGTYKVWDGLYHELHNEPEKQEVFDYTLDWIKENL